MWAWRLDHFPSSAGRVAADIALLDEEELGRFRRFHFDRDRTRFAVELGTIAAWTPSIGCTMRTRL